MLPSLLMAISLVSCNISPLDTGQNNGQVDRPISPVPANQPKPSSIQSSSKSSMSDVNLSKFDTGRVLTLKTGQMLILRLEENPTTGYRWSKIADLDTQVLQLKSDNFNASSSSDAMGAGGERVFTFQAKKLGQTKLQLKKVREWESEQSAIELFEIIIQVTE